MTDIGTGSYTIIAQTAAEMMGLEMSGVEVKLGKRSFPMSSGSGEQWGAGCSTASVYVACVAVQDRIAENTGGARGALRFADGTVEGPGLQISSDDLASDGEIVAEDGMTCGPFRTQENIFGTSVAHFVEVVVNAATGEVKVRRMLAVCDAGRILNPVTARSQVIGAMVMGLGAALMEELAVDTGRGFLVNHDLASHEVPVHMDIPHQEVIFIDAPDPYATPQKAKGIGGLGLCGIAAAVPSAVYNATGVRVREYPITLNKLIEHLSQD